MHLFVADIVKSFETVDRSILDSVLVSLGLPVWFRHAYFEFHAHVRLRFKLTSGLGEPWTTAVGGGRSLTFQFRMVAVRTLVFLLQRRLLVCRIRQIKVFYWEKVHGRVRTRGRNWVRTSVHPRRLLT